MFFLRRRLRTGDGSVVEGNGSEVKGNGNGKPETYVDHFDDQRGYWEGRITSADAARSVEVWSISNLLARCAETAE